MLTFNNNGEAGIYVKYQGDVVDTAIKLPKALAQLPDEATHYVRFTAGIATLINGALLTGGTSKNTCRVVEVVVTNGTLAGNDGEGILFINELSGPITSGENLDIGVTTQCVARTTNIENKFRGCVAKALFMTVETNSVRFTLDGLTPTNSAATPASYGHLIQANENIEIVGWDNVKNFYFINAVSTSNGVVNLTVMY